MGVFNHTIPHGSLGGGSRQWIEKLARWGYAAKGFVYVLIGILAVMAAVGRGGSGSASKQGAAQMIFDQPFGKFLAILVVIGILGFVVWRFVQAAKSKSLGSTHNEIMMNRVRYALSGVIYLTFAITLIRMIQGGGSGGNGKQQLISRVLEMDLGPLLVALAGIGVMIAGIFQWVKAYKEEYMQKMSFSGMALGMRENVRKIGKLGYAARGVVWLLIGFFLLQAGLNSDASQAQGSGGAFQTIEQWGGSWVLLIVALGVVAYGVFMFVKSRYYQVQSEF
jgi:type IV secretory pathway VirB2 component (pilin)